jgi:cytochrome c peroxidase
VAVPAFIGPIRAAVGPIEAASEMNMPIDRLMKRVARIPEYKSLFTAAFPGRGMIGLPLPIARYQHLLSKSARASDMTAIAS